jgi:hypothetical protein
MSALKIQRTVVSLWGAQAASLFFSAACRKVFSHEEHYARTTTLSSAGCRRLQAGSLRFPETRLLCPETN